MKTFSRRYWCPPAHLNVSERFLIIHDWRAALFSIAYGARVCILGIDTLWRTTRSRSSRSLSLRVDKLMENKWSQTLHFANAEPAYGNL